jgi:uncharacterized protein
MLELIGILTSNAVAVAAAPSVLSWGQRAGQKSRPRMAASSDSVASPDQAIRDQIRTTRSQLRATNDRQRRVVEIDRIEIESRDSKSIYFRSLDEHGFPGFRPGQHVIVERPASMTAAADHRCYTLSQGPDHQSWRITIRCQAALDDRQSFSAWAHREWRVGDRLRIKGPRGSFVLDKADPAKPVVFISAGIGITPMVAMLDEELKYPRSRSKWFFHQTRDLENSPLLTSLIGRIEEAKHCQAIVAASKLTHQPKCSSRNVRLRAGKLDLASIPAQVTTTDFHAFLCGPEAWMQSVRSNLVTAGVPDHQIHDESFGGHDSPTIAKANGTTSQTACSTFTVAYEATGKTTPCATEGTTLLANAKAAGIQLPASCRAGHCGTCAVKLLRGQVRYTREVQAEVAPDEILACICVPASDIAIQA